jgi:hypothetical protein
MTPRTRLILHALVGVLLLCAALAPWWRLGPVGEDLLLAQAPEEALANLSTLARWSLEQSLAWHGALGMEPAPAWDLLRLENLLWLLLSAWLCAALLARTVQPWLGAEAAHATMRTGLLVLPLCGFSLLHAAHVLARGEALALFFALASALWYLRSRQDRRRAGLVIAAAAAGCAGAAGHTSFALPVLVGVLEWLSARRHRSRARRLAASATAFSVFLALRMGAAQLAGERFVLHETGAEALARALAVLGRSLAPLAEQADLPRALAAGVLVLVALQPLLLAARSAPRTWGRFALAWLVVMGAVLAGSLVVPAPQRLQPWYLELLAPSLLFSASLCVAISARGGWRRAALPWLLALAGLWIAEPLVRTPQLQRAQLETLRARVAEQTGLAAQARRVLTGLEQQSWALGSIPRPRRERLLAQFVGGEAPLFLLSAEELLRWSRFDLFPDDVLWIPWEARARRLQRSTSGERLFWRESSRSPQVLDLDPRLYHALRLVSRSGTPTERAPMLYFRAEGEETPVAVEGLWIRGEEPAQAWFELSAEPRWMLAERIRRVWSEGDLTKVTSAEILRQLPAPQGAGEWGWVAWDSESMRSLEQPLRGPLDAHPSTPPLGEAWIELRVEGLLVGREKL